MGNQQCAADTALFVRLCEPCALEKSKKRPKHGLMHINNSLEPFNCVHIDVIKMPVTSSGNGYIFSGICDFTKWPMFKAMPDMATKTCARALVDAVVTQVGPPKSICSDRGSQFAFEFWRYVRQSMGISTHKLTSVAAPQSNGICERAQRDVRQILSILTKEYKEEWDQLLQMAAFAMRTSTHSSTGITPYEAVFLREPRLPFQLQVEHPSKTPLKHQAIDYVAQQRKIWDAIREHQAKASLRIKRYYDRGRKAVVFRANQKVILFTDRFEPGNRKLQSPFSIHTVVGMPTPLTVRIRHPSTGKESTVHVRRLQSFPSSSL